MVKKMLLDGKRRLMEVGMHDHGIPPSLFSMNIAESAAQALFEKVERAIQYHDQTNNRVFVLTGPDSPQKDLVCLWLLYYMAAKDKTVLYLNDVPNEMEHFPSFAVAIMNLEQMKGLAATKIKQMVRGHLVAGKILIVGVSSLEALDALMGTYVIDYITNTALEINIAVEREAIPSI